MKKQIIVAAVAAALVSAGCLLLVQPACAAADVQVAFSPDGGAERLVLGTINGAKRSIRVMAYSFTAEPVVRALILAKRRGVDVALTVDYRSNIDEDHSGRARAALGALVYAGVPVRVVKAFAIQHSKYLIADDATIESGSYNYTSMAARYNSENALVIRGDTELAARYLENWTQVSRLGEPYRAP